MENLSRTSSKVVSPSMIKGSNLSKIQTPLTNENKISKAKSPSKLGSSRENQKKKGSNFKKSESLTIEDR